MDEEKKPFDTVSIVILLSLAVANDGAEVFFDLLAATVVGLPGEAIMEPINLAMDGIVTLWFFKKCGFGGPSVIQLLDDFLELVGVPGRTICVVSGILIANNPKLSKIATFAASLETGGVAGELSEGAAGLAQAGEAAAKEAKLAEGATAEAVEGEATVGAKTQAEKTNKKPSEESEATRAKEKQEALEEGEQPGGNEEENKKEQEEKEEKRKKIEEMMETEAQRPPEEVEQEKLFKQTPKPENQKIEEEEPVKKPRSAPIRFEDIKRQQKDEEVKKNLLHPKAPKEITQNEESGQNDEGDDELPKAA